MHDQQFVEIYHATQSQYSDRKKSIIHQPTDSGKIWYTTRTKSGKSASEFINSRKNKIFILKIDRDDQQPITAVNAQKRGKSCLEVSVITPFADPYDASAGTFRRTAAPHLCGAFKHTHIRVVLFCAFHTRYQRIAAAAAAAANLILRVSGKYRLSSPPLSPPTTHPSCTRTVEIRHPI